MQGVYSETPLLKGPYVDGEIIEKALCVALIIHMSKLHNYSKIFQNLLQYYAFYNDVKL